MIHCEKPCLPFSSKTQLALSHICMDGSCSLRPWWHLCKIMQRHAETPYVNHFQSFQCLHWLVLARSRSIRRTLQRPSWQHRGGTRTSKGPRIAVPRCAKAPTTHWCPSLSHVSIAQNFKRTSNAWNDSIWNCHEWSCVCPSCVVPLVAEPAKKDRQSSEDAFAASWEGVGRCSE